MRDKHFQHLQQMKSKTKILLTLSLVFLFLPFLTQAETTDDLTLQIEQKKNAANDLKKQMSIYQENIKKKQQESASLANQLSILDNQIAKTNLDIKATEQEINTAKLESRKLELQIINTNDRISNQKLNLSAVLQEIHENDQKNELHIFLLNNTISDFYNQIEYTRDLQVNLQTTLGDLKTVKKEQVDKKSQLEAKQKEYAQLKDDLELKKTEITGEVSYKDNLLVTTKQSEKKYNELYKQAKRDQDAVSAQIAQMEKALRSKLKSKPQQLTSSDFDWPLSSRRITTTFHDPGYPFRYLFEHPAIDIAVKQGTSIRAPADGYVLNVRNAGMGYSYISLIHSDGLSTVYGHVSKIFVQNDEFVAKGEIIGNTGGMPGTQGAGNLTTGPHLHFEVRLNGIPVNPLNYLP
ncbi:MAG: Peptidase M23B [Parcubacteria group bacterium GW2011_GWC2_39_14]|nr:MAG: Peptidase M23B [Parcubacteria group bacterium GW2011_GWC2_39_14]KKR55384.1 MAG: Peptidase M23B [Parcubacteria group bacterium GW2011_GWA2_40_23]